MTQDILDKYVPLLPKTGAASEVDSSLYHIFLVSNFGVNFNGASHIDLKDGAQWWSSIEFPGCDVVSSRLSEYDTTTVTGVILMPVENGATTRETRQSSLQKAETRIKRLRTILDVVENATFTIQGNIEIEKDINRGGVLNSNISIYMNRPYHHFSEKEWIIKSYYENTILINSANLAFSSPSSKSLNGYIHKSIDSLDLARSVTDMAISHMLIWAAIESLLSPSDHSELISNITLALIGLQNKSFDRLSFWDEAKKSYTVRSRIVHSFDLPTPQVLNGALSFSEARCGEVIRYAISEGQGNQLSRDVMIRNLRKKALS